MIQAVLVGICVLAAVGYAGWRVYRVLRLRRDPCYGCSGCALKNQVCNKKVTEKFGHSK